MRNAQVAREAAALVKHISGNPLYTVDDDERASATFERLV